MLRTGSGSALYKTRRIGKYASGPKEFWEFFCNYATVIVNFMY